jgi:hypothetical protein
VDPARAIDELEFPDCPHPVAQFLLVTTRDGLIAQAKANQQAQALDAERAPFLAAQQAKRASDEAEGSIVNDLLSANPTTTAAGIVNNAKLAPEAQNRLVGMAARTMQQDPPAQTSAANAVALLDRIRQPVGGPNRIVDYGPLVIAFSARGLSGPDFQYTLKQLAQAQSPEGALFAQHKRDLLEDVAPLFRVGQSSDPNRAATPDPAAASRLYQFDRDIDRQADRYRVEGKDPFDLLDPSKPDYLGSAARLVPYVDGGLVQLVADPGQTDAVEAKSADTPEAPPGLNDTTAQPASEGENPEPTDAASAEVARQAAAGRQRASLIHHGEGTATDLIPILGAIGVALAAARAAPPAAQATISPVIRQFRPAALSWIGRILETTEGVPSWITGLRDVLLALSKPPAEEITRPPGPGAPADPSSGDQSAQPQARDRRRRHLPSMNRFGRSFTTERIGG